VPQHVLEEDLQGDWGPTEVEVILEGGEPVEVRQAGAEAVPGAEWILAVRGSALTEAG
jgi:hypothetical protein